jgi:hypothetical protein
LKILIHTSLALACLCSEQAVFAQGLSSPRSTSGLFGKVSSELGKRDLLTFLVDVSEKRDTELPVGLQSTIPNTDLQSGGFSTTLIASTDYARNRRRTQLTGTALTALKYYDRLDRVTAVSHTASATAKWLLSKSSSLQFDQKAAYSPSYLYQLFPIAVQPDVVEPIPASPDYQIETTDSYAYSSKLALALGSRATRLTTSGQYDHTDYHQQVRFRPNLRIYEGATKLSQTLSPRAGLSAEYQYRAGEFGYNGRTKEQRLAIGFDYTPALSRSRRAAFRIRLAPSMIEVPRGTIAASVKQLTGNTPPDDQYSIVDRRLYRLQGDAAIDYPFRRNWGTFVSYKRGLEFLPVLGEPILSEGGRAELSGQITRRFDVSAMAGYAVGVSALSRNGRNLETYTGDLRLRVALTRELAVYSEYLYYYYDLRGQVRLAPDLPRIFTQQSVRAGVMMFVPTFRR